MITNLRMKRRHLRTPRNHRNAHTGRMLRRINLDILRTSRHHQKFEFNLHPRPLNIIRRSVSQTRLLCTSLSRHRGLVTLASITKSNRHNTTVHTSTLNRNFRNYDDTENRSRPDPHLHMNLDSHSPSTTSESHSSNSLTLRFSRDTLDLKIKHHRPRNF